MLSEAETYNPFMIEELMKVHPYALADLKTLDPVKDYLFFEFNSEKRDTAEKKKFLVINFKKTYTTRIFVFDGSWSKVDPVAFFEILSKHSK